MNFIEKEKIEALVWDLQDACIGGFIIVDVCPKCGKINITVCKHDSCYNNQCSCGYLTGFIGRNHAN